MVGQAIWLFIVIIVSAIPLNIAVKLLGGRSSILKVIFANLLIAIISSYILYRINNFFGFVSFILMIFVYKVIFDIGWMRAFLAWIMQFVVIVALVLLLVAFGLVTVVLL